MEGIMPNEPCDACAGNGLGPEGGVAIGEALKVNTTLHTLYLGGEWGSEGTHNFIRNWGGG